MSAANYPITPDDRYFVVRGRLWRCSDPSLNPAKREQLVTQLMQARNDVKTALRADDAGAEREARQRVHLAKLALGERGSPWWTDGAPDFNRYLVRNTPYSDWYDRLG